MSEKISVVNDRDLSLHSQHLVLLFRQEFR